MSAVSRSSKMLAHAARSLRRRSSSAYYYSSCCGVSCSWEFRPQQHSCLAAAEDRKNARTFFSTRPQIVRRSFSSVESNQVVGCVHVAIEDAQSMTAQALEKIGWDRDDAALQAEIMTAAELCGNNQGLVKMYQPHLMAPSPHYIGKPIVTRETLNSAVIDAQQSPGMLAAVTAVDVAVQKLRDQPDLAVSVVTAHNSSTSSGQLAFYAERVARQGFVAVLACNSPELVAPAPGAKPVFGTNPLAVGIPLQDSPYPFTFDMATSSIALFGVLSAKAKGEALPEGVAYDQHGQWTTDASAVLDEGGSIATFGGHKGLGLALTVELLAGALSGSAVLGEVESKKKAQSWGHVVVVLRPEALVEDFPRKASSVIAAVKASGADNVRIPGERSARTGEERRQAGVMPIPERIWESIVSTAQHGLKKTQ